MSPEATGGGDDRDELAVDEGRKDVPTYGDQLGANTRDVAAFVDAAGRLRSKLWFGLGFQVRC